MSVNNLIPLFLSLFCSITYCLKEDPHILVIGSGPAGIAAASKLWKHNFTNLKILEAEGRIGGRVHSVKFGDGYVDMGGEWCHGEKDNIVYDMVKPYNILKHTTTPFKLVYSNGSILGDEIYENLIEFYHYIDASGPHREPDESCKNVSSLGDCFEYEFNSTFIRQYKDDTEKLKISFEAADWLENYLLSYDSTFSLNDLASDSDYMNCEGDLALHWDGRGYKTILEVMLQKFPDPRQQLPIDGNILLNKEVVKVIWNSKDTGEVSVRCSDNSSFEADFVIFTPSLGVLKANHEQMFKPKLSDGKIRAIKGLGFGAIMKIILHFPETWWNPNEQYGFVWSAEDKNSISAEFGRGPVKDGRSWLTTSTAFFAAENNPKVLIAFFAGAMVPELERENDQVLTDGCMYMLRKFLGKRYQVLNPDGMIKSTWYSNSHFRGTYSYDSATGSSAGKRYQEKLAAPLKCDGGIPCVLFAGEATHPYYFSTVHGAIETGYREAGRIINLYAQK